ncbi:MAG: GNAT family N-acetyltransferase [Lentisphaerae bacterium]|nr:GNAT family N-acetyltransferase [Lentisphaerota bacterium]
MIKIRVINDFPGDMLERIAGFYIEAGWINAGDDFSFLCPALQGSELVAGAFDGDMIIGCARALSDGCSDAYIQDVVVSREYRGNGIGSRLICELEKQLRSRGIDWIALVGEPGTEEFYRKLGWQKKAGFIMWQPGKQ